MKCERKEALFASIPDGTMYIKEWCPQQGTVLEDADLSGLLDYEQPI